ncbi:hypothetical protein SAMN02745148_01020 [Modicisalibacter ilicicola DSM 19980]|uniref:SCP-2 sterol transfer family protein n=1 Tax=Modicisalibacter ilicicola DSM 19980 TaxID=1121942 RepID=A0A1M4W084_9GAMM|nr:hypothetical protein [Halomonas ilicicola]SHE74382.1 hypothetical protein SAMN02745148_01020 [Halomonas ilicicola DSM 19980]
MKLRLVLWLLGLMLKRARRGNRRFRETLDELRHLDWGIATEDLSIARHYRMTPDAIESAPGLPVDLDLELRFRDADAALSILRKPTQRAFLDGMMDGRVRLVGDSRDLTKLQKLLRHLR